MLILSTDFNPAKSTSMEIPTIVLNTHTSTNVLSIASNTPISTPHTPSTNIFTTPIIAAAAGAVALSVILLIIICCCCYLLKKRSKPMRKSNNVKLETTNAMTTGVSNKSFFVSSCSGTAFLPTDNPNVEETNINQYDYVHPSKQEEVGRKMSMGYVPEIYDDIGSKYVPEIYDDIKSKYVSEIYDDAEVIQASFVQRPYVTDDNHNTLDYPLYGNVPSMPSRLDKSHEVQKAVAITGPSSTPVYDNTPNLRTVPVLPPKPPKPSSCPVVYSEPVVPSDFISVRCTQVKGADDALQVYGPLYSIPTNMPEMPQGPVEITSDKIKERQELGTGKFGQVILATTNGLSLKDMRLCESDCNRDISILVAVRKLKLHPSKSQQEAFDKEVKFMSHLNHPNVARFIAVCYQDPAFIMMEYMEEGDLNQFLQEYSEIVPEPNTSVQIATSTVLYMASQIASAMKYLASLGFVHRDLACRNCFIGQRFAIKLADMGMNSLYQSHYYPIQGNRLLPIRWMATECFSGKFSEKSDVWAFGVTMWELFALAKDKPYPHLSDEEVIQNALRRGFRQFPSRFAACPLPVYEIMEKCWIIDMQQRVTFQEICQMLQSF